MQSIPDEPEVSDIHLSIQYQTDLDVKVDGMAGNGWLDGCVLTAQSSPNMTRQLSSGHIQLNGSVITVAGQNSPTVTANGSNPRWVLYEISSSGVVFINHGTPDVDPLMPSPTANRIVVGADYVPAGTTSLTGSISRDMRVPAASLVRSVNSQVGDVSITVASLGAETAGAAATVASNLTSHLNDTVDAHDASAISVSPTGAIASTDVQSALAELDSEKSSTSHNHSGTYDPVGSAATVASDLTSHLNDTTDAHDASAISFSAVGNIIATDVQAAIAELDTEKSSTAHNHAGVYDPAGSAASVASDLTSHLNDTSDAHDASAISFSPTGGVASTDVQLAIAELDTEKASTGHTHVAANVTDFDTQVRASRLDQMAVPTADVSMNTHKITNVTDPSSAQDAATKNYVDTNTSIEVQVQGSSIGTRHTLNFASTSIQASASDNPSTEAIDVTLNLPQFGGILIAGHSYSQLGGGGDAVPQSADRFVAWSHIIPAALKIPDSEVKMWGRSGGTISSANSDPSTDFVGSGVYMRHVWPSNWFNTDSAPRTVSDAVTTNASATLTSATADFKSTDAGKYITGTNIPANTKILSVTNSTTVTLSANATGSGTSITIVFGSVRTSSKQLPTLNVLMYGHNELRFYTEYNGQEVALNAYENGVRATSSRLMASEVYNSLHPLVVKTGVWSAVTGDTIQTGTQYIKTTTNTDTLAITIPPWFKGGTIGVNWIGNTNYVTALGAAVVTAPAAGTNENWTLAAGTYQGYKNVSNGDLLIIDKGTASEEYVLVNSGAGTTTINVKRGMTIAGAASGSTFTHSNGAFIQMPTTSSRVTYAVSGDGKLNGSTATGTIYLGGQGVGRPGVLVANRTRVHVCHRFTVARADAGKTITFTVAGIPTGSNEEVAFDAFWIEDPEPTHTLWVNQPPNVGQAFSNLVTNWPTVNTALDDVIAEFGNNVQVVDLYSKWQALYNGTWRSNTSTGTSVTFWPYDATKCVVDVGSVLRSEAEEMLVTAITKTSDTNWDLTVTRNWKGIGGGLGLGASGGTAGHNGSSTRGSGVEVADQLPMSVDRIHPSVQGHIVIASAVLEKIATLSQTADQIASSGIVVGRRSQSYANGQYVIPQIIGNKTATAMTSGRLYAYPIYIAQDCVIDQMAIEVTTGAASSQARLGLYLDQMGLPGYRVADIGGVATTSTSPTTYKTIACWLPVKPGWYWVACAIQGGTPSIRALGVGARADSYAMPYTAITDVFTGGTSGTQNVGVQVDSVTGELPTSGGAQAWSISGGNIPLVALRVTVPITD